MATTTKLDSLKIHLLSQAQFDSETKSENDLYLITDGVNIPNPPTTDGTYTLKCTVASGVATYSWVKD